MKRPVHTDDSQKKELHIRKHFSLRINLFFFVTFVLFSVLIMRLALLQFVEGPQFKQLRKDAGNSNTKIAPIRGNIFDMNGAPIASTLSSQSLFYRIESGIGAKKDQRVALAKKLAVMLAKFVKPGTAALTAEEIIDRMDVQLDINGKETVRAPAYTSVPRRIVSGLTNEEIAYFSEHRDELPGIEITEESTRDYENDKVAVQLVGYLRPKNRADTAPDEVLSGFYKDKTDYLNDEYVGFDGLEYMYQDELRGKNGVKSYPINASEQIIGKVNITAPEKGHNLFLTINKDVQLASQKAIEEHVNFLRHSTQADGFYTKGRNAAAGYAVAMEVDSGRVVAMANYPDYNPDIWSGGISQADLEFIQFKYMNGTIRQRYADLKDYNKHPSSLVPPGSTLKPLTVLTGLKEGVIGPYERFNDPGTYYYGKDKSKVSNSDNANWGILTPSTALEHSANTFMSEVGNRLYMQRKNPIDLWDSYMKQFGLGLSTGSGLLGESAGIIEYRQTAKNASAQAALVLGSFGQQARYTVLQLAQYASMLANHGKRYTPTFVDRITTYDGTLIRKIEPKLESEATFSDVFWNVVKDGMLKVNVQGFGNVGYTFARKTGTSEQSVAGETLDNAVFIAYAPADKPKIAVAVVVPEGGFGSFGAAPIARKIIDAYDQHVGLYGTPTGAPAAP